ncbi:MAG: hypothetical protein BWY10_01616 [Chloroflexi bacterium ADurb.Bin180]|nr:MAG: hypothetical protein BWY10_01616 [Chloroflexi bacterium ADurb.Bin180]
MPIRHVDHDQSPAAVGHQGQLTGQSHRRGIARGVHPPQHRGRRRLAHVDHREAIEPTDAIGPVARHRHSRTAPLRQHRADNVQVGRPGHIDHAQPVGGVGDIGVLALHRHTHRGHLALQIKPQVAQGGRVRRVRHIDHAQACLLRHIEPAVLNDHLAEGAKIRGSIPRGQQRRRGWLGHIDHPQLDLVVRSLQRGANKSHRAVEGGAHGKGTSAVEGAYLQRRGRLAHVHQPEPLETRGHGCEVPLDGHLPRIGNGRVDPLLGDGRRVVDVHQVQAQARVGQQHRGPAHRQPPRQVSPGPRADLPRLPGILQVDHPQAKGTIGDVGQATLHRYVERPARHSQARQDQRLSRPRYVQHDQPAPAVSHIDVGVPLRVACYPVGIARGIDLADLHRQRRVAQVHHQQPRAARRDIGQSVVPQHVKRKMSFERAVQSQGGRRVRDIQHLQAVRSIRQADQGTRDGHALGVAGGIPGAHLPWQRRVGDIDDAQPSVARNEVGQRAVDGDVFDEGGKGCSAAEFDGVGGVGYVQHHQPRPHAQVGIQRAGGRVALHGYRAHRPADLAERRQHVADCGRNSGVSPGRRHHQQRQREDQHRSIPRRQHWNTSHQGRSRPCASRRAIWPQRDAPAGDARSLPLDPPYLRCASYSARTRVRYSSTATTSTAAPVRNTSGYPPRVSASRPLA